jgi:DNA-binding IclR family transcriptional regulator
MLNEQTEPLSLDVIYKRAGVPRSTTYRILMTLVEHGIVNQSEDGFKPVSAFTKA